MKKPTSAVNVLLGAAAVSAVGAAGAYLVSRDPRPAKRLAKKAARGAERAVLDLDRVMGKYF